MQVPTKVRVVRMLNGDEVIGKVTQIPSGLEIKKPVGVTLVQRSPNEQPQLGFVPYIPLSASDTIQVAFSSVLFIYDPVTDVENAYNTTFGTGIIRAPASSLKLVQ